MYFKYFFVYLFFTRISELSSSLAGSTAWKGLASSLILEQAMLYFISLSTRSDSQHFM